MNMNRLRTAGVIAAGALLLSMVTPTAAFADDDPDQKDIRSCHGDCTGWSYAETKGGFVDGPTRAIGAWAPSCPNRTEETRASGGESQTIGNDWSWSTGQGADAPFLAGIGVSVSRTTTNGVSRSATTSTSFTFAVPKGEIGRITFRPLMYHSEGRMSWTEHYYNETHDTNEWHDDVITNTPITLSNGTADGMYNLETRPMTTDDLLKECQISPPPIGAPHSIRDLLSDGYLETAIG